MFRFCSLNILQDDEDEDEDEEGQEEEDEDDEDDAADVVWPGGLLAMCFSVGSCNITK